MVRDRPRWQHLVCLVENLLNIDEFTNFRNLLFHVRNNSSADSQDLRRILRPQIAQILKDVVEIYAREAHIEISHRTLSNYQLGEPLYLFTNPDGLRIDSLTQEERIKILEHFGKVDGNATHPRRDSGNDEDYRSFWAIHSYFEAWLSGGSHIDMAAKISRFQRPEGVLVRSDNYHENERADKRYDLMNTVRKLFRSNYEEICLRYQNNGA